jgi:hypothetical protein
VQNGAILHFKAHVQSSLTKLNIKPNTCREKKAILKGQAERDNAAKRETYTVQNSDLNRIDPEKFTVPPFAAHKTFKK